MEETSQVQTEIMYLPGLFVVFDVPGRGTILQYLEMDKSKTYFLQAICFHSNCSLVSGTLYLFCSL